MTSCLSKRHTVIHPCKCSIFCLRNCYICKCLSIDSLQICRNLIFRNLFVCFHRNLYFDPYRSICQHFISIFCYICLAPVIICNICRNKICIIFRCSCLFNYSCLINPLIITFLCFRKSHTLQCITCHTNTCVRCFHNRSSFSNLGKCQFKCCNCLILSTYFNGHDL